MRRVVLAFAVVAALGVALLGSARADEPVFEITIKDHRFEPEETVVPAGEKVKLVIKNLDATPEEFESYDLNREKVVNGNSEITVFIGPLDPGTYGYFGEFNPDTAQGRIIAR